MEECRERAFFFLWIRVAAAARTRCISVCLPLEWNYYNAFSHSRNYLDSRKISFCFLCLVTPWLLLQCFSSSKIKLKWRLAWTESNVNCNRKTGYIGEFEIVDDHRASKIVIELTGRLNKCGVISPRFDVPYGDIEKWIVNLLPSRQFGHLILSTTYGIMTHEEARRKKTGGKILGFFY